MKDFSADILVKELTAGREHKRQRVLSHWRPNDDAYNGIVPKYSKLPYNFHLPILSGFEDTLVAKIDEAPLLKFGSNQGGEARLGQQYDSLWRSQSEIPDNDYAMADLLSKRHAARYGRAFLKTIGTKTPFEISVIAIDPYDMVTDPNGGGDLEDHKFVIQDGIFRNKRQLLDGVKSGMYDRDAVKKLLDGPESSEDAYKTEADLFGRWSSLNQAGYGYEASGSKVYRLCEHVTVIDGERRKIVWSPESMTILSNKSLKESYGCDLLPWASWAPFYDNKVFWSKAPDDDVRQASEAMRVTVMEMMVNTQKQNWGTKIIDPERISSEDMVRYAPNGIVVAKPGSAGLPGGLDAAYKVIETPTITVAANVVEFLDRFVGQKTGITPDTQGKSGEDKVGIYFGNIEQVADRMGLTSRYYKNCWRRVGTRFLHQAKRNISGKVAVEVLGAKGSEMEYLMARNIRPDLGVSVTGGSAEATVSEAKRKERGEAIDSVLNNPATGQLLNLEVALSERLKSAGFEEEEVRLFMNKQASTEFRDQQLRAQEKIEELLEGKKPDLYYGARISFLETLLTAAQTFTAGKGPEHERLIAYAQAHMQIVAQNTAMKAQEDALLMGLQGLGGQQAPPEQAGALPPEPQPSQPLNNNPIM